MNFLSPTKGKIAAISAVIVMVLYPKIFGWHRPYINWSPWELAEYLVEKNRPASECFDLHWFEILSPTQAEQRALCVYEYAKRKKDPSACELLMPSSYGLSCVGVAEVHLPCDVTSIPYSVYWRDGDREQTEHITNCLLPNSRRSELGNQCCEIAKVTFLEKENDCSGVKDNTPIYDHCLYSLAWKLRNPVHCFDIVNINARSACEVQTKAIQSNPSICRDCQMPIEKIEDLQ